MVIREDWLLQGTCLDEAPLAGESTRDPRSRRDFVSFASYLFQRLV